MSELGGRSKALCLGLSVAASYLGLAAIIGAFLAGMVAAETRQRETLIHQLPPILAFVVPFFFVVTGVRGFLSELGDPEVLVTLAVVVIMGSRGQVHRLQLGGMVTRKKIRTHRGCGMVPRGEVGIIVASLGD